MENKFNFTAARLQAIPIPTGKSAIYYDSGQPGLRLLVTPTGNKSYQLQWWSKTLQKPLTKTLGKFRVISITDARQQAASLIAEINAGSDIEKNKREALRSKLLQPSVQDFSKIFIERHCEAKNLKTTSEIKRIIEKEIVKEIGTIKMCDVHRVDLISLLDKIQDRGKLILCNRVHSVLSKMFNFAIERGVLEISPLQGVKKRAAEVKRERVLNDSEIRLLWNSLGDSTTSLLLKFLLLTGQRTGETRLAEWSEIENNIWHIPAQKTKNGTPHDIPLSTGANDILKILKERQTCRYIFHGNRDKADGTHRAPLDKDFEGHHLKSSIKKFGWERTTVHDLRRTMRSKLAELGISPIVGEKILNHKIQGVLPIYDRFDYRREKEEALQKWSDHIHCLVNNYQ